MVTQDLHIRWMIRRDMPEVLTIEADSFAFPWSEKDFFAELKQRNSVGWVTVHDDDDDHPVLGYMVYRLHKYYIEVVSFAVHPAWRRRGIGTAMADKLAGKLSKGRRRRLLAQVRDDNLPAQQFWRAMGYRATKILRGVCPEDDADGYLFEYQLQEKPVLTPSS